MALFQSSVLKKNLENQDKFKIEKAYNKFKEYFYNTEIQKNIIASKEEQFQATFLTELFVEILGYTMNPRPDYELTTEFKNLIGSKKADGAILENKKAIAVIELKSTKVKDLEKIRQQAFDYKSHHPACVYVISSTFDRLRFYINNSVDFEEFNLFNLTQDRFELLYFCLAKENLLDNLPLKTKEASLIEEKKITNKLYSDYSLFKREIYRDIVKKNIQNPALKELTDKNIKKTLFQKTQKLLDRFLFIFFAEDRGLLPPNSISKIVEKWNDDNDWGDNRSLYSIYQKYFDVLNIGRPKRGKRPEIFAYNGGLFIPDPILDSIIIDDNLLLKHTSILTKYDFETDVDVNILGHIFENSLNEIESVNAEIEGVEFDNQKAKRKKDGVFYTPKYITKYIVDNTVGKLCKEKKQELEINEEIYLYAKHRSKKRIDNLEAYRNWLLQLTICDPACGSGAFLNQALDYLINEHEYIDELTAKYHNAPMILSDIENSILENNIFGVDINQESVEIAKLSLWLRTAQKGRKLTSLSDNIKCGNSLIDDPEIAGEKAFNWQKEFPEVFTKGGFDVVIGNPPYVQLQNMKEISLKIKELRYKTYESTGDLYCLFYEKGYDLLKQNGLLGYITSSKWMRANYGKSLRKYLLEYTFPYKLIELGSGIFDSAVVDSNILLFKKEKRNSIKINSLDLVRSISIDDFTIFNSKFVYIEPESDNIWTIFNPIEKDIRKKIEANGIPLKKWDAKINFGIKTGYNSAFIIDSETKNKIIKEDAISSELINPLLRGRDVQRYYPEFAEQWLISTFPALNINIDKYVGIKNYLKSFGKRLDQTGEKGCRKKTHNKWFETQDSISYYREFDNNLLIWKRIGSIIRFSYGKYYCLDSTCILASNHNKYLLCVFNSKMGHYLMKDAPKTGTGDLLISVQAIEPIKIPQISNELPFNDIADKMLDLNKNSQYKINSFLKYIKSQFSLDKLSKKLQNWHELEFGEFIIELNKAIKKTDGVKLKKIDELEWMEVFETKKAEAQKLKAEIDKTDKEIDVMVYQLYDLTKEEIKIVENS